MPIQVACRCGQRFAAKDALAGKRVKCPKCGAPLTIPSPKPVPPTAKAPGTKGGAKNVAAPNRPPVKEKAKEKAKEDVFDEIGLIMRGEGNSCPECGNNVPPDAVLCVNCGYNFKTGRKLETLGKSTSTVRGPTKQLNETEKMLDRAAMELEKEPVRQDEGYGSKWSAYLIAAVMFAVAAGVIAGGMAFFNYMEGNAAKEEAKTSQSK